MSSKEIGNKETSSVKPLVHLITYSHLYTYVTALTICAQFVGLMTAYALGVIFYYDSLTKTHCNVPNFWPSISKCTGEHLPTRYSWRLAISLTAFPRMMDAFLYYKYFVKQRPKFLQNKLWYRRLNGLNLFLYITELVLLYTVTFISSIEHADVHLFTWIAFLVVSLSHMITFLMIFSAPLRYGGNLLTQSERISMNFRRTMLGVQVLMVMIFIYFGTMHSYFCQPNAYSYAAICEFFIAASNFGFQSMQLLDFKSIHTVYHWD